MKKQIASIALALGLGSSAYAAAPNAAETPAFTDDLSFLKSNQKIARIEFYDENGKRIDPKDMPGLPPVPSFTFPPTPVASATPVPSKTPSPSPVPSPVPAKTPKPSRQIVDFGYRDNLFRANGFAGIETSNTKTRGQSSTDYGADLGIRTRLFTGKNGIVYLDGEVSNVGGSGDYGRKQLVNLDGELTWFPGRNVYIGPVAGFTFNNKDIRDIDLGQDFVGGVSERMKGGKAGIKYLIDDLEGQVYWANQFGDVEYSLDQNGAPVGSRTVTSSRPENGLTARLDLGQVEVSTDHTWYRGPNNGIRSRQHSVGLSFDPGNQGGTVFGIEYSKSKAANASGSYIKAQITYRGKGKSRRNR